MKTLVLVRHAKSSWDNPDWSDFERPLNKRGNRDAPFMAEVIKAKNIIPDFMISSPAIRAKSTALYFAKELDYDSKNIKFDLGIYEKGMTYIKKILTNFDDEYNTIMLFGHNPDMTSLSSYLTGEYFDNVPTCGIICIDFNIDSWTKITNENGRLRFFIFPKLYFQKENLAD